MIDILISSPHNKTQLIGNFSNDEGDDNFKKAAFKKNNNFARASRFLVYFFAVTARVRRENP